VGVARLFLCALLAASAGRVEADDAGKTETPAKAQCVGCLADPVRASDAVAESEWPSLEAGEILVLDRKDPDVEPRSALRVRALGLIEAPPEQVWEALLDFERWPEFMPLIRETEIMRRDSGRVWVRQRYRVVFLNMEHTSIYETNRGLGELSWSLDRNAHHDIADTEGRWWLLPVKSGAATLAIYAGALDAGRGVPGFVERLLMRRSLPTMLRELRGEVKRRSAARNSSPG
jgi:ribosome-associated toxin RatA of RatAB toxin-antitoxin module